MSRDEDIERTFEGQAVLQQLLTASGSIVDVEDVASAFAEASAQGVPAPVVIQALWEDEPRFNSPAEAARLFGNLLGLYELVANGLKVDLTQSVERVKRVKAQKPEPFGETGPTDDFVEAAWRYFDDFPKERERHAHAFENRQDALISWLDASGLSDSAFGLTRFLLGEVFAHARARWAPRAEDRRAHPAGRRDVRGPAGSPVEVDRRAALRRAGR